MRRFWLPGLLMIPAIALSASCASPRPSPVKEITVQSADAAAQSYAVEEPEVGNAEALTAEPVIQGASLGAQADVLLGEIANGGPVYLSQFPRRVVLVNFWNAGCEPCVQRLRELAQVSTDYEPFGLVIANVNLGDDPEAISTWLDKRGLGDFSGLQLTDASGLAAGGVGIVGAPAALLYDENGKQVMRYSETSTISRIRQDLDLLLK
jgi:thiol-disulfide isomerase/thioredoxin